MEREIEGEGREKIERERDVTHTSSADDRLSIQQHSTTKLLIL